jgi:hypothetical protein
MYDKLGKTIVDRREMLRVKVKSLAVEAKIIRKEELRSNGQLREELYLHRTGIVRSEARNSHLAYGFIKGRSLEQMERTHKSVPDIDKIKRLCIKYGPANFSLPAIT